MTIKPAYEELEQRIKELEAESEKRKAVRTRKDTDLGRKADEFINKFPSAIKKIPPKNIQYLVEDLQIHKTELEMQNEKLRRAQLELQEKQDKYYDLYDNSPVGHFSIDNKGVILEANITGATLLGVERGLLKGRLFSDFITRDDQDIFYLHRKELLETKAKQRCELRLVKKNGSQFYAHLECIAILDKKGKLNQIRAVVSDISEPKPA
jgi:PAS domain S-box-containing protein